ncbi:glycosyltransferase family protein [Pseudomonas fluorescens]|uniref:glycosyltransferase family protein n=1 Tax=Pseudomonas fluorescens TaxID=294 RepID=UPI0030D8A367
MSTAQLAEQASHKDATAPLADIHDRVMEAYYGKLGEHFMRETQTRIHWICAQVSGKQVLDVGCSQGIVPLLLAREGCSVTGVDTSPQAIAEALDYLQAEPAHVQQKITYVNADFLSLDASIAEPDTIVISEVLEHLVRPEIFVEKATSLLKPGGRLIITVPFGVNDFIDHKHTFYLLAPFRMLSKHLHVTEVKVLGKWLGMVAQKGEEGGLPSDLNLGVEQIQGLEKAFEAVERNLNSSLSNAKQRLEEANNKYRAATEQIALLKPEAQKVSALQKALTGHENALVELAQVKENLDEANTKYRNATEQAHSLKSEVKRLESLNAALQLEKQQAEEQRLRSEALCADLEQSKQQAEEQRLRSDALCANLEQNKQALLARVEELMVDSQSREQALHLHEQHSRELANELAECRSLVAHLERDVQARIEQALLDSRQFEDECSLRQALEVQINELQQQAKQERDLLAEQLFHEKASHQSFEQLLSTTQVQWQEIRTELERELSASKGWLEEVNQKYKEATGKQIPHLQQNLDSLLEKTAAQQKKIEELNDNLERANTQRHLAEQRLIKTRSSMTYQLGYQIKSNASSLGGLVRLPTALFNLYRKAAKQRKQATQKSIGFDKEVPATIAPVLTSGEPRTLPAVVEASEQIRSNLINQADQPRTNLKVACVMDEFTYGSYRYECNLLQLTPENWQFEIESFQPELLFIESAWRGKDELWGSKVGHNSQELQGILAWCADRQIPTVFWNKEDPVHFETFLTTAKQFDFVFTTDIDCIHRYKGALGHERVYLLPFACQPAAHNPIELYERKDAFCFAGAYYARYPERTRDLGNFVRELPKFRPLEIFDRNFEKNDPNYQFPVEYRPYIVGTLSFDQIDTAYKGYRYAINLNSIKQSQSMFARRVFELLGCNTITVSNFSRGVRLLFGDLVVTTDDGQEMVRRLEALAGDEINSSKLRLAALRKVMQEHTYAQRLDYVMSKVMGKAPTDVLPQVHVVASAANRTELQALVAHVQRQTYTHLRMSIVVGDALSATDEIDDPRVSLITAQEAGKKRLAEIALTAPLLAGMLAVDYYGPNYLLDLVLATRYSQAKVTGKSAFYENGEHGIRLNNDRQQYRPAAKIAARSAIISTCLQADEQVGEWVVSLPQLEYVHDQIMGIDAFNYCRNAEGLDDAELRDTVDDLKLHTGISIDELQAQAEAIEPMVDEHNAPEISGRSLAELFGPDRSKFVHTRVEFDNWHLRSELDDNKHEYIYSQQDLSVQHFVQGDQLKLYLDVTPGLNVQLVVLFLDAQKQRISHVMQHANRNHTAQIPPEAAFLRLGVRVYANGHAEIRALVLGHRDLQPSDMLTKAEHLLVTNHYPAYDDLYRNGFVHTRVRAYQERGLEVDVFRLRKNESVSYHEFENVNVVTGSKSTLAKMLEKGQYKSVLVHFLDADMWKVLSQHVHQTKVVVWVHGAEIQPWWRREYNYSTEDQLQLAKLDSEKRLGFWRDLLQPMPANLKLIFVSRYFAEEVMEDLGFRLPEDQYDIIHNPINTDVFSYQEKPVEQRKKILSIRPYASGKYANDLSVKAIQLLAGKPYFHELEFHMIGDGVLFEETLLPLRQYPNVKIERRFLKHQEIAALHKDYGMFLCPTRMDAQGVSRDEAMSSGLVPVTNAVTAIPEFVDDDCGVLAPGDDAEAMAEGIARVVEQPRLFAAMSAAARARIERQTSMMTILSRELDVIEESGR